MLILQRCKRAAYDFQGGRCRSKRMQAQGSRAVTLLPPQSWRWPLRCVKHLYLSIDVACVTPLQQRGGCAFGRVCEGKSQALARRSDLHAMQAHPSFHEIMPGCLCVSVCAPVCVCVCMRERVCVCVCVCVCPTRHQVGVCWRVRAWSRGCVRVCKHTQYKSGNAPCLHLGLGVRALLSLLPPPSSTVCA